MMADLTTNIATMSSLEIADLTSKAHRNVVRDIRAMLVELHGEGGVLSFEHTHTNPQNGQSYPIFRLPRRECLILVSGYSVELRARIIDRWEELERQVAAPAVDASAILNDPAALRGLLLQNVEKVIALEAKVEADKPKTTFFDSFINADGLYGLQNAGRALNARPNLFCRWLKQDFLFHQGGNLVPRIRYIQAGIFEVKSELVDGRARPQTYVTPKGLDYLGKRLPPEIKTSTAA